MSALRLKAYDIEFKRKHHGLQLADLIAVLDGDRPNFAFEIVKPKIYSKGSRLYGLKIFHKTKSQTEV